ncbi:MAG: FAD-dependent oxidoreductase [Planctomycetota bacterium]
MKPRHHQTRTPIFAALRSAMRLARRSNHNGAPPVDELVDIATEQRAKEWTRRRFLRSLAVTGATTFASGILSGCATLRKRGMRNQPSVAIVGAGLAGLNAAQHLKKLGINAVVYEGSARVGGRIFSAANLLHSGVVTELGGEFIDSNHEDVLGLVKEFGLELMDMDGPSERALKSETFFFQGRHWSMGEIVREFRPLAAQMEVDLAAVGDEVNYRQHSDLAVQLDRTALADYLLKIGAPGVAKELLEVAYVTEYGLDAGEQSALNMLFLIGTETQENEFHLFGESDERFKIRGGNGQLIVALAERVEPQIRLEYRLEAIGERGGKPLLSFAGPDGAEEVGADFVILAVPFSVLRGIDWRMELPPVKRKAVFELGYGTNAKVLAGCKRAVWRDQGFRGMVYTDDAFQCAWDNMQLQGVEAGGVTFFLGGRTGLESVRGTAQDQVRLLLPGLNNVYPGISASHDGPSHRFHWPSHPWSLGSYACYKPGQWTTVAGVEFEPVNRILFAGEHCSSEFQGFMNGAAETGRLAATRVQQMVE